MHLIYFDLEESCTKDLFKKSLSGAAQALTTSDRFAYKF